MPTSRPFVLLVDDEPHSLSAMRMALEDEFEILTAPDAAAAARLMEEEWVQVVVCDQRMPGQTGVEFLTGLRERWPETVRLLITGYTDPSAIVDAINLAGIHQFIAKPWHPDQLLMAVRNAAQLFHLARENERLALEMRRLASTSETRLEKRRRALRQGQGFDSVLRAPNSPMNGAVDAARHYAAFDVPVLLTGEQGTGKEQLAQAMHLASLRADRPFYALDLTGMPDELVMIELLGARRGAVAGGTSRIGLIQKADRGTLYLSGIETITPELQLVLLRILSGRGFTPVGGQETLTSNLRLIAGAGTDLAALVAEGRFRPDLYYALAVAEIAVPPLRARRGDIALLAQHMLAELAARHGKLVHGFDAPALEFLENYDWPGNLRELSNEITRMLILAPDSVLGADLISRPILQGPPGEDGAGRLTQAVLAGDGSLKERVELIEMRILRETLTRHRWNKSRAAAELGVSRVGLRAKLDRYGVKDPAERCATPEEEE